MSEMDFSWTLYVVTQCIHVCQSLILIHYTIMLHPMQVLWICSDCGESVSKIKIVTLHGGHKMILQNYRII